MKLEQSELEMVYLTTRPGLYRISYYRGIPGAVLREHMGKHPGVSSLAQKFKDAP